VLDWLYISCVAATWVGNLHQIWKLWKTKSTRSFSFVWLIVLLFSLCGRLVKAADSGIWCWWVSYIVSLIVLAVLVFSAIYCRLKYPGR